MDEKQVNMLKGTLQDKHINELLDIWTTNDRESYTDEAFEAIRHILKEKDITIPSQAAHIPKEDYRGSFIMKNNSFDIEIMGDALVVSGIDPKPILIPLAEIHEKLEIERSSLSIKSSVRIYSPVREWVHTDLDASKAAELSVKLVKAWFAIPRIFTCKRVAFMARPAQKVELTSTGCALIGDNGRTEVKPEHLTQMSLGGNSFGTNPRWVEIPNVASLILPEHKQTIFWFHRYIEAWKHASVAVFKPAERPGEFAPPQISFSTETAVQRDRQAASRNIAVGAFVCFAGIVVTAITYSNAQKEGGVYVVAWGAVIFGALQCLRGLVQSASYLGSDLKDGTKEETRTTPVLPKDNSTTPP